MFFVEIVSGLIYDALSRPRPYGVPIIGRWDGYSAPSPAVMTATFLLMAGVYCLVVQAVDLGNMMLVAEVARSLGLSDQSARWAVASLADHLQNRQVLLVLDGCEHLADACAVMVDALLRGCPGLRLIATSRHVLGVAGEVTIAVPPMTVPAEGAAAPEELLGYEAMRLFAGRGAAVLPGFTVDAGNGAAVARVCRALDGIPLAVELAAVRLRSLSPEQILSRLGSRFQLLSGGGPAGGRGRGGLRGGPGRRRRDR